MTPKPDPLEISMLNPPPIPKEELQDKKIYIYLTDTQKTKYNQLKGDDSWSQVGRRAFKMYFEGGHSIQMPNIEDYLREIVALVTHQPLPTQPRSKEDEAKWNEARNQAIGRKKVQAPLHVDFRAECVPELKVKFKKVEEIEDWKERWKIMGLEHTETHESPKVDDKSFADFMSLTKELNKKGFENCKWKKEVAVCL